MSDHAVTTKADLLAAIDIDIIYGNTANHYAEHLPWIAALAAGAAQ
jgi:hypothetical protein